MYLAIAMLAATGGGGITLGFTLVAQQSIPETLSQVPSTLALPIPPTPPPSTSPPSTLPLPTSPPSTSPVAAAPQPASAAPAAVVPKAAQASPIKPMTLAQRGAAALALIVYPWQATGYTIAFLGPRDRLLGFTTGENQQIEIYVRPKQSIAQIAHIIGHELGHAVDFAMTTDAERAAYRQVRGLDDRPWFPECDTCTDYASPAGDWAETFAYWLVRAGPFASQLASRPSAAQLEALAPLFAPSALAPPAVRTMTTRSETTTTPVAPTQPSRTVAPRAEAEPESAPPRPRGLFDALFGLSD